MTTPLEYASPTTLHEPGPVARFFLRPIGWPTHGATAVLLGCVLFAGAPPSGYFVMVILSAYLAMAVGAWWAGRGLLRLIMRWRFRETAAGGGGGWCCRSCWALRSPSTSRGRLRRRPSR